MVNGIKDGAAPKAVVTAMEEQSRRTFENGNATFMRNWPYAYATGQKSKIKGKFEITTLPGFAGQPRCGRARRHEPRDLRVHGQPRRRARRRELLHVATSASGSSARARRRPPPMAAYDVESVRKAIGLPDEIKAAVAQAQPRPVSPVYPQISQAIYENVNKALSGQVSTDDAVKNMNSQIEKALATF